MVGRTIRRSEAGPGPTAFHPARAASRRSPRCGERWLSAVTTTWWVTNTVGRAGSSCPIHCRSASIWRASRARSWKKELSSGCCRVSPSLISEAVSRQRHHWLEWTSAGGNAVGRKRSPMRTACARPSAERLRWVVQSSRRNPGGSLVPGASAWRIKAKDRADEGAPRLALGGCAPRTDCHRQRQQRCQEDASRRTPSSSLGNGALLRMCVQQTSALRIHSGAGSRAARVVDPQQCEARCALLQT